MGQKYAHVDADNFVIGFYDEHVHTESGWPDEAIAITDEDWTLLLDGQAEGKRMKVNDDGTPELVDPPPPSADELAARLRARRNAALAATDWVALRDYEQGKPTSPALGTYRQTLRDLPAQKGFPDTVTWPNPPEGVAKP